MNGAYVTGLYLQYIFSSSDSIMFLFGLRPTIYLLYIYVNMLRMCSFTYHRGNLLTNRNGDRQTFVGIRMHFHDRSRGFAILEIEIWSVNL